MKNDKKKLEKIDFSIIVDENKLNKNDINLKGFGNYINQNIYRVDYI